MKIRQMTEKDLNFAAKRTAAEGWASETLAVFESFYNHDPSGCFIAEEDDQRIGMCVAVPYKSSGFLGELIVLPEARGGFVGPRIFNHAINYLHQKGITNIYLDGVEDAVPYYEFVGFKKICRSLRFVGKVKGCHFSYIRPMLASDLNALCRMDHTAFGDDRSFFLQDKYSRFPHFCKVAEVNGNLIGYIMAQPGRGVITAGPWIVDDSMEHPEHLVQSLAMETGDTPIRMGVLDAKEAAVKVIHEIPEFKLTFFCWRMVLGKSDRLGNSKMCYAIGSPAKG